MNILFLITRRQTRGAETFAVQLGEVLAHAGHRLTVASLYAPASTPLAVPAVLSPVDLSQRGPRAIPHFGILRRIDRLVREQRIDLVQANASDNLKYAVLSRKLFGWKAPLVYRNASIMSAWVRRGWHHRLTEYLLRHTDAIASVSTKSKLDIEQNFGIQPERVLRLGIAADLPNRIDRAGARDAVAEAIGGDLPEDEKLIFHVGAFTPEKNHVGLRRVFGRIEEAHAGRVRLVSIGNGPLLAENQASNDVANVSWLGYRTDVQRLLPAADLLLLPSLIEGTPGVVLEAGANRVVPIANRVGAVDECYPPELFPHLTVPKGDEQAMAERAIALLNDDTLRASLATKYRAFVEEHYAMDAVARQFEQLYIKLIA